MSGRGFAAVSPTIEQILRETRVIRGVLRHSGVVPSERDDLEQDIILAAWLAIRAQRYRPDPSTAPGMALRRWLARIAYFTAVHHRKRAHVCREVPAGSNPSVLAHEPVEDVEPRLKARSDLAALVHSGGADLVRVAERAAGATLAELSAAWGTPISTTVRRLESARMRLAARIGREVIR